MIANHIYKFVDKHEVTRLIGYSNSTLKRYRTTGKLQENIHWISINSRSVRYNIVLVLDWFANVNDPQSHQIAIDNYLLSMASNQRKIKK